MPIQKTLPTKTPVHIWTDQVEREAQSQLERLATLPFLFHHVAVMPDVHAGRGSTVGTVIATRGAIIPACVGVDIGCGMVAAQTNIPASSLDNQRSALRSRIEQSIPVGFDQNKHITGSVRDLSLWEEWDHLSDQAAGDAQLMKKAMAQVGSLGGGNHFIEICLDEHNQVWVLLHSGSRHIGKTLADIHIHSARGVLRDALSQLPDRDLAYLTQGTPEFESYIHDLEWAQRYAYQNREEMMRRVLHILIEFFGETTTAQKTINCHHNYTAPEDHYGQRVWVTRKGAVSAKKGEWGIIPGSMGTRSYIVQGLGNPDSFESCSHGAGRRMSRTQAKRVFSRDDLVQETKGVECRKDKGVLDEIPSAYKDIDTVMKHQTDLVEIRACLKQVICVKG